jgi:hypothetical protein
MLFTFNEEALGCLPKRDLPERTPDHERRDGSFSFGWHTRYASEKRASYLWRFSSWSNRGLRLIHSQAARSRAAGKTECDSRGREVQDLDVTGLYTRSADGTRVDLRLDMP